MTIRERITANESAFPLATPLLPCTFSTDAGSGSAAARPGSAEALDAPQYFQTVRTDEASVVSTVPLTLVAITPCRLADTRPGSGYPALGSTPLPASAPQTLSIAGSCGTPASTSPALAYSLNVSVVPPAGTRGGYLTAYPNPASPVPLAASLTWNPADPIKPMLSLLKPVPTAR